MAKYRLKRKTFGFLGNAAGEVLKGTGRAIKTAGSGLLGTVVGGALGTMLPGVGNVGGAILGATAGKHVIQGVGNAIGKAGQTLQS